MAKTVQDLLVDLKVVGIQGVHALKGSLRQLSQATKFSDKDIEKLSSEIKNYTKTVGASEKAIQGQIAALKGVREQARIGSKAYKELSRDIERYEKRLKSVGDTSEATGKKVATAAQLLAQYPARKPSAFNLQINQLNKDLADLKVNTDDYVLQLRKIQEREDSFRQAQARQSVIARAQTAAGGVVDPRSIIKIDTALPKTTAALSLKISELKTNLQDLDFTSDKYRDTQREILGIEKQLIDISNRRVEAIKGVSEQQRRAEQLVERSRGRKQRILAGQAAADAEYNAALAAHIAAPSMPVRQLSDLYKTIGQVSATRAIAQIEMMGNSYKKVASDIKLASSAGLESISSIQAQRAAFAGLRDVLDPTSRDFREVTKEVERLDRRLEKLSRRPRPRRDQLAQGAGTIASAGIFGGPLGMLGAGAGFAVGGVPGAIVGAGVGAAGEQLRQQLAGLAEYTTQLNLAKQTLALASDGQDEYNKLLQTARNISKDYAISLKETIGGFSQIAVAARANNLTLAETETIFRGLVASGIAFGKTQQDIDAIIRASVQVLSKGKLSAEELQGQIGERLPGAVAKFAEATSRSLPQLAKDLKAGTVQISDFVDFTEKQLFDYDEVAKLIGDAPEKAGARLKLALDEAVENFGGFFLRVGSGFQDLFKRIVDFANDNKTVLQNLVVDFIFAAEKIKQVFSRLGDAISRSLGPALGGIVSLFGQGVDAIHGAVMRERELQAGGFNAEQALRRAEEAARNVTPTVGGIPGTQEFHPSFQRNVQEAYGVEMGLARQRGAAVLSEQGQGRVDTSQLRRDEIIKQLFDFKPFAFGDFESAQELPGLEPDPDTGTGIKDITKAVADAKIASINLGKDEILGLQARIKLEADLAREAAKALPEQKQRVELARINKRETDQTKALQERITRIGKEMGEQAARQMSDRKRLNQELQQSLATRKLELGLITQEEFNQLEIQRERARLEGMRDKGITTEQIEEQMRIFKQLINQTPIDKFIKNAKDSLNDLQTVAVNVAQGIGDAVGNALTNGITSLIEGTKNAKEVFADFLKSVGQILAQEGAKMIATYIAIGAAKAFAGLFGPKGPDIHSDAVGSVLPDTSSLADAALATPLRANGGPVNAGRPYMVGERGPELFVPGQSGGIMRNEEMRRLMGRSPAGASGGAAAMNFTFETTNIGGTEYVSREQLEAAMATTRRQAANDGARRGMSMTLDKMQNSPRTRSRIGIS